jgi:hypothetical protein
MLFEPLFERFACGTPLSVMTRALLENALQPDPLDELFERLAVKQYTRELLFSTVVETMALVACRIYKSPRAVYIEHPDWFPVTLKCVYEKLQGIELPGHHRGTGRAGARLAAWLPGQDSRRQRPGGH